MWHGVAVTHHAPIILVATLQVRGESGILVSTAKSTVASSKEERRR